MEMIALKEIKVCRHGLHQNVEALRDRTVKLYQDNMTVVGALREMSSKCSELMDEIKGLVPTRFTWRWSKFAVKQICQMHNPDIFTFEM